MSCFLSVTITSPCSIISSLLNKTWAFCFVAIDLRDEEWCGFHTRTFQSSIERELNRAGNQGLKFNALVRGVDVKKSTMQKNRTHITKCVILPAMDRALPNGTNRACVRVCVCVRMCACVCVGVYACACVRGRLCRVFEPTAGRDKFISWNRHRLVRPGVVQ